MHMLKALPQIELKMPPYLPICTHVTELETVHAAASYRRCSVPYAHLQLSSFAQNYFQVITFDEITTIRQKVRKKKWITGARWKTADFILMWAWDRGLPLLFQRKQRCDILDRYSGRQTSGRNTFWEECAVGVFPSDVFDRSLTYPPSLRVSPIVGRPLFRPTSRQTDTMLCHSTHYFNWNFRVTRAWVHVMRAHEIVRGPRCPFATQSFIRGFISWKNATRRNTFGNWWKSRTDHRRKIN